MKVKIFGDTTPIDWQALGVRMPFAPMHELAKEYKLEKSYLKPSIPAKHKANAKRTAVVFEIDPPPPVPHSRLTQRIYKRVSNTMSALDQATPDTICINLGGGYHHAGKYPNTGYAYSLINDHIWAVDYQLNQDEFAMIGIIDMDFHLGGGTAAYYTNKSEMRVAIYDQFHEKGVLQKHSEFNKFAINALPAIPLISWPWTEHMANELAKYPFTKILLNIGTDWYHRDPLFGKYGGMYDGDLLAVWTDTIQQIINRKIPLAITCGGGCSDVGLPLYSDLISWLAEFQLPGQ